MRTSSQPPHPFFQFSHETRHFNHKGGWETGTVTILWLPVLTLLCVNMHMHGTYRWSGECKRISPPMCQLFTQRHPLFHLKYLPKKVWMHHHPFETRNDTQSHRFYFFYVPGFWLTTVLPGNRVSASEPHCGHLSPQPHWQISIFPPLYPFGRGAGWA